jgi:hypothetical protein
MKNLAIKLIIVVLAFLSVESSLTEEKPICPDGF